MTEQGVKSVLNALGDEEEEEIPEYEVPEDLVSDVKPCQYLADIYQEPITDFTKLGNRVPEFLKMCKYNDVPQYQNIPITDSYKMFVNSFNELTRETISSPPDSVAQYTNYLTSLIPQKFCFPMANSWPPSFPRIVNTIEPEIGAMVKMLTEASDPTALLRFLSLALFPKTWSSHHCGENELIAICPCKFKGKDNHWAYIEKVSKTFVVCSLSKMGEMIIRATGTVDRIAKTKDKKGLMIKDVHDGLIADIYPLDEDQLDLWVNCLEKFDPLEDKEPFKPVPFPYFFTSDLPWFPDIFYRSFYEALTTNDMILLRACISLDAPYEVADGFLTISLYARKSHIFFATIVSYILENDDLNPMAVYAEDSFFRKFSHALFKRFSSSYLMFLKKVVTFIDRHKTLDEKLFFGVIKYIMMSSGYIPIQIRHFASIIRSYVTTKFNLRGMVYFLIGGFFGLDFICPVLAHPERYFEGIVLKNPQLLKQVSDNLQYIFHGALLPDSFSSWNDRVLKHTIPALEEFLFSIGDIAGEIPSYSPPSVSDMAHAVDVIMHCLLKNTKTVRQIYDESRTPFVSYAPQLGLNFTSGLCDFFRQYFDKSNRANMKKMAQKVKPNPLKFPPLPMYGAHAQAAVRKGENMFNYQAGSFADMGDYKERSFGMAPSSPTSMKLPKKPINPHKNPLVMEKKQGKIAEDSDSESSFTDHHDKKKKKHDNDKKKKPTLTSSSMPEPPKKKSATASLASNSGKH
ncbi:hypothetical protein TVAG_372960 [Trichomonas vaginalis G3]|uniref:Ras-GAP domain-containing protein n=1 Tax=Trichomonas vaginalis (strain ATCC PRA-98 / G3) TaxID=412133 RepID=A2DZF9_TRIV3|nr:GTPase activation domain, GAP family [Trichomonas vaginalis G3]EAY14163.1 hypothetical protein TVAG_372960 [Trichomonas vaginalis G3]KAI5540704.1 GTPase activation domain, GAP family [Trichomonas vaginalis G3]|eukprot:XP_001326386.1 hypothetical protein [Trichomonas vaginalis G3]